MVTQAQGQNLIDQIVKLADNKPEEVFLILVNLVASFFDSSIEDLEKQKEALARFSTRVTSALEEFDREGDD